MYTMYLEDQSSSNPRSETFYTPINTTDNVVVLNPKINFSVNQADTLEFILPYSNYAYNHFRKMSSIVTVYDNRNGKQSIIFRGRVIRDEVDFYLQKHIYCESELAYLHDCILPPKDFKGSVPDVFKAFMNEYNTRMSRDNPEFLVRDPVDKTFQIGTINVNNTNWVAEYSEKKNWVNLYDAMKSTLIDNFGGYFKVIYDPLNKRTIQYVSAYGEYCDQEIVFGTNMLDFSQYITTENLFTCLVPLGHEDGDNIVKIKDADITINGKKVRNTLDFIYDGVAVQTFGKIWASRQWPEIEDADQLYQIAVAYMQGYMSMAVSLTVRAMDLSLLGVDYKRFHIGDRVRVISKPHGVDSEFVCTSLTLELAKPENSEYVFGYSFNAMTDQELDDKKDLERKFLYAKSLANTAKKAADAAQADANAANAAIDTINTETIPNLEQDIAALSSRLDSLGV